jgi:hypothetical protein
MGIAVKKSKTIARDSAIDPLADPRKSGKIKQRDQRPKRGQCQCQGLIAVVSNVGLPTADDIHLSIEILESQSETLAAVILSEIQPAKVEELKPSEQVKKSQHANCPITERALSIKKDLYPPIAGLQPLSYSSPEPGQVIEDCLQEDEVNEQNFLQYQHRRMKHSRQDRPDLAEGTGEENHNP